MQGVYITTKVVNFYRATTLGPYISAAISWLLVVIGWVFVSRDHNRREHRKEVWGLIGEIGHRVRTIEESAHRYLMLPGDDLAAPPLAMNIKRELVRLSGDLQRLKIICPAISYEAKLIEFRRRVTGGDFEVRTRHACTADSLMLLDVSTDADAILSELERQFSPEFSH